MPAGNLKIKDKEGSYSHVYNKGIDNKIIFNDEEDYKVFQDFLKDYLTTPLAAEHTKKDFIVNGRVFRGTPHQPKNYFNKIELVAYSLNPDRFHLILRPFAKGVLENFIRSLCTRYSIYFNKKYKRTGSLFAGPYKSVVVKDEPGLLHLTQYLHHTGEHSSYEEYLGTRNTSWVKPKAVLSSFGKGANEYRDLVEQYEFDTKGKELIKDIIIEPETERLVRSDFARKEENSGPQKTPEKADLGTNLKPLQRIPEFAATTLLFFLLFSLGIRNITAKETQNSKPAENPTVLAETIPVEESKPITMTLTIQIKDGSLNVNIRQKPTTNSAKIGQANDGDKFEFVTKDSGWYGVKMADGSTGYISSIYIKEGEANN